MAQDNEVNINDVFAGLKRFIKRVFSFLFDFFGLIYAKRIILIILIATGLLTGFFIDRYKTPVYHTTLQIRLFQESTEYVYDLIDHLNQNLGDSLFLNGNGFSKDEIKGASIEPMANMEDLLSTFKDDNSQTLETLILNTSTQDLLTSEFFRSQYRHHQVKLNFGKSYDDGSIKRFMEFLNSNPYYQKLHKLTMESLGVQIAEDEKSIGQINSLITNYKGSGDFAGGNEISAIVNEKKTSTLYDLFSLKRTLVAEVQSFKQAIEALKQPVVLTNNPTVLRDNSLLKKSMVSVPLILAAAFILVLLLITVVQKTRKWVGYH